MVLKQKHKELVIGRLKVTLLGATVSEEGWE